MKIAYLTSYLGKEFTENYCKGKKYALSGPLKSLGIARSMMAAGHEVTIFSPGIVNCNAIIPSFTEVEEYPEGVLTIKYCRILSKRRCDLINQYRISRLLKNDNNKTHFDILVYYNIVFSAALCVGRMKNTKMVLEYEDNIFNKALIGDRNSFSFAKRILFTHVIKHTDGIMAVCNGLMLDSVKYKVLTPGIINEDVINNVSTRVNSLVKGKPVHIILTGGIHYSKGGDLLVKAMSHIQEPCIVSVYGNCDLNDNLKRLISEIPKRHKFFFNGYLEHAGLIKTLTREADILINTTRSMGVGPQSAGFPFKMMEYASTGRPIISSEIGKLDDNYNRHITYYSSEQPAAIARAVEDVIAHYDEKVQLALELQKIVMQEYTIAGTGEKIHSLFNEIVQH